ncbi:MAG: hypothetical protein Q9174_006963, partial [Haloplaca sp. 1 TL-2023]
MEINTSIIVSCMPTVPALIRDIRTQISRVRRNKPSLHKPSEKPSKAYSQKSLKSSPPLPVPYTTHSSSSRASKSSKPSTTSKSLAIPPPLPHPVHRPIRHQPPKKRSTGKEVRFVDPFLKDRIKASQPPHQPVELEANEVLFSPRMTEE